MKNHAFIFLLGVFAFLIVPESWAQESTRQLIITEASLDSVNQEVWIEIFNPSDIPLVLSSMRISGIKTPSVLPREFDGQRGIELKPGERIIICSDIKSFRAEYGDKIRAVELKLLRNILSGGFIAINHMAGVESSRNIVRFGQREKSQVVASIVSDDQILNFSDDGKSYSRQVSKNLEPSSWSRSVPTPGK